MLIVMKNDKECMETNVPQNLTCVNVCPAFSKVSGSVPVMAMMVLVALTKE